MRRLHFRPVYRPAELPEDKIKRLTAERDLYRTRLQALRGLLAIGDTHAATLLAAHYASGNPESQD